MNKNFIDNIFIKKLYLENDINIRIFEYENILINNFIQEITVNEYFTDAEKRENFCSKFHDSTKNKIKNEKKYLEKIGFPLNFKPSKSKEISFISKLSEKDIKKLDTIFEMAQKEFLLIINCLREGSKSLQISYLRNELQKIKDKNIIDNLSDLKIVEFICSLENEKKIDLHNVKKDPEKLFTTSERERSEKRVNSFLYKYLNDDLTNHIEVGTFINKITSNLTPYDMNLSISDKYFLEKIKNFINLIDIYTKTNIFLNLPLLNKFEKYNSFKPILEQIKKKYSTFSPELALKNNLHFFYDIILELESLVELFLSYQNEQISFIDGFFSIDKNGKKEILKYINAIDEQLLEKIDILELKDKELLKKYLNNVSSLEESNNNLKFWYFFDDEMLENLRNTSLKGEAKKIFSLISNLNNFKGENLEKIRKADEIFCKESALKKRIKQWHAETFIIFLMKKEVLKNMEFSLNKLKKIPKYEYIELKKFEKIKKNIENINLLNDKFIIKNQINYKDKHTQHIETPIYINEKLNIFLLYQKFEESFFQIIESSLEKNVDFDNYIQMKENFLKYLKNIIFPLINSKDRVGLLKIEFLNIYYCILNGIEF